VSHFEKSLFKSNIGRTSLILAGVAFVTDFLSYPLIPNVFRGPPPSAILLLLLTAAVLSSLAGFGLGCFGIVRGMQSRRVPGNSLLGIALNLVALAVALFAWLLVLAGW